jgi:cytoskeletal protein CcmA (bactofilin family)
MSYTDQEYQTGRARSITTFDDPNRASPEGSFSVIDQFSRFDGTFVAERDLRIDGDMKGTIECKGTLFVANGATVSARVEAENITIAGELTGEINCRGRLQLLPSGRLKGKVRTKGMIVAEGAVYDGDLVMDTSSVRAPSSNGPVGSNPPLEPSPPRDASGQQRRNANAGASRNARPAVEEEPPAPSTFIRRLGGQETPWEGAPGEEPPAATEEVES